MNTVINIGIYMISSSLIMVGYVWIKYVKHSHLEYKQMLENTDFNEEGSSVAETLAA